MSVRPFPQTHGGLDLSALASEGLDETTARTAAGESEMATYLAAMLAEQRALLGSQEEEVGRQTTFEAAQAAMEHALARREAALQEAAQRAQIAFEQSQGAASRGHRSDMARRERAASAATASDEEAIWRARERFRTDENIRQAMILAAMEAEAGRPRLSDFGPREINAYRGQALHDAGKRRTAKPKNLFDLRQPIRYLADTAAVTSVAEMAGDDPALAVPMLRRHFRGRTEDASLALHELGYLR